MLLGQSLMHNGLLILGLLLSSDSVWIWHSNWSDLRA